MLTGSDTDYLTALQDHCYSVLAIAVMIKSIHVFRGSYIFETNMKREVF